MEELQARTLVESYFERAVDADRESYFALFDDDVVIEDEGRERHGNVAVREWRTEVPPVTYAVRTVTADGDSWVAVASVAGEFPGSPVDLRFAFRFDEEGRIAELPDPQLSGSRTMETMAPGLTIGEFSRVTHLTVRMLRRYHDGALLEPERVDPVSGYRYYSLEQVPTAQTIRRLRDLGLPIAELRELLATADETRRDAIVVAHLDRLEDQLERTHEAIRSLRSLLGPRRTLPVSIVELPAQPVVAVRDVVDSRDVIGWYAAARAELDAAVAETPVLGPIGGRFAHELFTEAHGSVLVYTPNTAASANGRVERLVLPQRTAAVVTHHGSHDDIDLTYAVLGSWVFREGIGVEGPVEELYDIGPADETDPTAWRTRLAWPVSPGRA